MLVCGKDLERKGERAHEREKQREIETKRERETEKKVKNGNSLTRRLDAKALLFKNEKR